jgi:hypothetical protein
MYETPILVDLCEVAAGNCGLCMTGGGGLEGPIGPGR